MTKGGEKIFIKKIAGAKNMNHQILKGGHFIQEDAPAEIVELIVNLDKYSLKHGKSKL